MVTLSSACMNDSFQLFCGTLQSPQWLAQGFPRHVYGYCIKTYDIISQNGQHCMGVLPHCVYLEGEQYGSLYWQTSTLVQGRKGISEVDNFWD